MKLSIVIPSYNTDYKMFKRLFETVNMQTFKDYEIIIVDDCSDKIKIEEKWLNEFLNISSLRCIELDKNYGPSYAREVGFREANGEYIMFCDADDKLYGSHVLENIFNKIEADDPDIAVTTFLEDTNQRDKDGMTYTLPHFKDVTWMHGKVYKKQFLVDNDIHFHHSLRANEDGYFNNIAFNVAKPEKVKYYDEIISYIWISNPNSTVRKNNCEYNYSKFFEFIIASHLSCYELYKRNVENLPTIVIRVMLYIYFTLQTKGWRDEKNSAYLVKTYEEFKRFYTNFSDVFKIIDKNDMFELYTIERNNVFDKTKFIEQETFKDFLQRFSDNKIEYDLFK